MAGKCVRLCRRKITSLVSLILSEIKYFFQRTVELRGVSRACHQPFVSHYNCADAFLCCVCGHSTSEWQPPSDSSWFLVNEERHSNYYPTNLIIFLHNQDYFNIVDFFVILCIYFKIMNTIQSMNESIDQAARGLLA